MNYQEAYKKLEEYGQLHVLKYYEELSKEEQETLSALSWCVIPYIPFDLAKIALALGLTSQLRRHVK